MRKNILSTLLTLIVVTLSSSITVALETDEDVRFVREGVDYTQYDKFLIQPLEISKTRLVPPPWVEGKAGQPRPWHISQKNALFLQEQYHASMKRQLEGKGGYQLAGEPASDTLEVEVEIISLTPWADPKDEVTTKGSGEMQIRAEVRDSRSGEILVIIEGSMPVGEDYHENTQFSVDQDVEELFESWGEYLRLALNEAKVKK